MEHNSYANNQLMATKNADNHQHDSDKVMASFYQLMPLAVAVTCLRMEHKLALAFLETEVEKALGRPLTSYDRALLRKEYECKQACGWLAALFEAYAQRCREDEIIRRVVWRRG